MSDTTTVNSVIEPFENWQQLGSVPRELAEALSQDAAAKAKWIRLAESHRREYVQWIEGAKRAETRARRAAQALEMIKAKN